MKLAKGERLILHFGRPMGWITHRIRASPLSTSDSISRRLARLNIDGGLLARRSLIALPPHFDCIGESTLT